MKIAITGASGFVGKYLSNSLKDNDDVEILELSRVQNIDITQWEEIKTIDTDIDVVVHLAAKSFVPDSYTYPRDFFEVNINGTLNALELCRKKNARLIYVSSYVYGPPQYLPVDELHPTNDFNPYCESKLLSEQLCISYAKHFGVQTIILRPFNIYGVGQPKALIMQNIIDQIKSGKVLLKDPRPKRDYLHVTDLVKAIEKAIYKVSEEKIIIYNIGFGKSYALDEMLGLFKNHYPNFEYSFSNEYRPNEVMDTVCNINKAKTELNWEPTTSLSNGIKNLLESIL
ncbi:MAG: NAD(P)-dependent oxidoreductase [Ferruginibacter sp.]|nr:NAD(P)-dependent oxidoreductase [Ferruginibacter sp.]